MGLVILICQVVWLFHKAGDVFSELEMLGTRASELSDLLGQIRTIESPVQIADDEQEAAGDAYNLAKLSGHTVRQNQHMNAQA